MSLFVGRNRYLPARFLGAAILCAKSGKTCFTCSFFENRKKNFFFLLQLESTATFIIFLFGHLYTPSVFLSLFWKKVRHLSRLEMTTTLRKQKQNSRKCELYGVIAGHYLNQNSTRRWPGKPFRTKSFARTLSRGNLRRCVVGQLQVGFKLDSSWMRGEFTSSNEWKAFGF